MIEHSRYNSHFRADEASQIISAVDSGDCVSVIGAPSVGKTNLVRFLDQGDMAPIGPDSPWEQYVHSDNRWRGPLVVIPIDPNLLLPPLSNDQGQMAALSWPGFEMFIHRLRNHHPSLYPRLPEELKNEAQTNSQPTPELKRRIRRMETYQTIFDKCYENVTDEDDPLIGHLALRLLEDTLEAILEGHRLADSPIRLVFLIDEFDYLLAAMPNYFFVALRGIRDRFKYRLTYVTFTRNPLPDLVSPDRMKVLEPFIELFHDHQVWLGPYGDRDCWDMVDRICRRSVQRDDKPLLMSIAVSGGFAGLLRAAIDHSDELNALGSEEYLEAARLLCEKENVCQECQTLLRNLTNNEIKALYAVVNNWGEISPKLAKELQNKSLFGLSKDGSRYVVRPYLLAVYIASNDPPPGREPPRPSTLPEGHALR